MVIEIVQIKYLPVKKLKRTKTEFKYKVIFQKQSDKDYSEYIPL